MRGIFNGTAKFYFSAGRPTPEGECVRTLAGPALADRVIEGQVTVVRDVDTIVVAGTPVRLNGLDGPETSTQIGLLHYPLPKRPQLGGA